MTDDLLTYDSVVRPEWIDEFGHLNMAYYVLICDSATFNFWDIVNGDRKLEDRGGSEYAVVEAHVNYLDEVREGDPLRITTQLLAADAKRFRLFHTMYHAERDYIAATNEVMALGFNLNERGLEIFKDDVQERLQEILDRHGNLERHDNAGRAIGQPRKR
ncbi:MAG: thioesterase family protein [Pseudomonadota bacterium]